MSQQDWTKDQTQVELFIKRSEAGGVSRRTFLKVLAAAAGGSVALAACGPAPTTQPAPPAEATKAPAAIQQPKRVPDTEQVLRQATTVEPSSHDYNADLYCDGFSELWAGLMHFNTDYVPVNYAAKSVDVKDNVWTFKLVEGMKWTNGDPVTADDFEWSFKRQLTPETKAPYAALFYDVKNAEAFNQGKPGITKDMVGVKALDPQTLQMTLEGPRGYFGAILAYAAALPNNPKNVQKYGDGIKNTEVNTIVNNGPWLLKAWEHQKSMTFERNENFILQPKPKLRKIIMPIIARAAQLQAYEKNEIDRSTVNPPDLNRVKGDPKLSKELVIFSATGVFYVVPNPNMAPFDQRGVRRALNHAINREAIANNVLQGLGRPAFTFDSPDMFSYLDPKKYADIEKLTRYDPKLAMEELKGTPYEGGKNWPKVVMTYRNGEEQIGSPQAVQAIQAMLKENLNMNVELEELESKVFRPKMWDHKIQLTWVRWYSDYPDPNNNLYQVWYSASGASGHRHDFANKDFDKSVDEARGLQKPEDRIAKYAQAEKVGLEDGYATYVYYLYWARVYKPWIGDLPKNSKGDYAQDVNIYFALPQEISIIEAEGRPKLS